MNKQYVIFGDTLDAIANAIRVQTHLLEYPKPIDENNYIEKEVSKCQALIDLYLEMEG